MSRKYAECSECGWGEVIEEEEVPLECPECESTETIDTYPEHMAPPPPTKKNFAVQWRDNGLVRWEYFPMEFTDPQQARMCVLREYGEVEILQWVEVANYKDLVERYAQK